jgi:hypothetical protein
MEWSAACGTLIAALSMSLLGGCGIQEPEKACGSSTDSSTGSPTPSADSSAQTITLRKRGFSFQIPLGWRIVDRSASRATSAAEVEAVALLLKSSPAKVQQYLDDADAELFAIDAQSVSNDIPTTLIVSPISADAARDKNLLFGLDNMVLSMGGHIVESSRAVETPLGLGFAISYTLVAGKEVEQRRALATGTSVDREVLITTTATHSSDADQLIKRIRGSLAAQC